MQSFPALQFARGSSESFNAWKLRARLTAPAFVYKRMKHGCPLVDAVIEVLSLAIASDDLLCSLVSSWPSVVSAHAVPEPNVSGMIALFIDMVENHYVNQDEIINIHDIFSARLGEISADESPVDLLIRLRPKYTLLLQRQLATAWDLVDAFIISATNPHPLSIVYARCELYKSHCHVATIGKVSRSVMDNLENPGVALQCLCDMLQGVFNDIIHSMTSTSAAAHIQSGQSCCGAESVVDISQLCSLFTAHSEQVQTSLRDIQKRLKHLSSLSRPPVPLPSDYVRSECGKVFHTVCRRFHKPSAECWGPRPRKRAATPQHTDSMICKKRPDVGLTSSEGWTTGDVNLSQGEYSSSTDCIHTHTVPTSAPMSSTPVDMSFAVTSEMSDMMSFVHQLKSLASKLCDIESSLQNQAALPITTQSNIHPSVEHMCMSCIPHKPIVSGSPSATEFSGSAVLGEHMSHVASINPVVPHDIVFPHRKKVMIVRAKGQECTSLHASSAPTGIT